MALEAKDIDFLRGSFGDPPLPVVSGQNAFACTLMRNQGMVNTVALGASGTMLATAIILPGDVPVTNISVVTGGTAEVAGTSAWLALYTGDGRLMAQSTNDTGATTVTANTVWTKALTTPQKTFYAGLYYVAMSVTVTTTMPTLCGITQVTNAGLQAVTPLISLTSGSGLGGTAPAAFSLPSSNVSIPYMFVS